MFTFLDLLVVIFMILAAATLLSVCLMFLIRNKTARRVIFYITSLLGLCVSWAGFRIGIGGWFSLKITVGIITALMCIIAFIIERVYKNNDKMFLIARILSAVSLVIGMLNAFIF